MKLIKKLLLSVFILIIMCPIILILLFFVAYLLDDKDYCLDTGICKENLQLNTEYGRIIISEENCKKYNWKWDSKKRYCNVN